MCSIAGFYNHEASYTDNPGPWEAVLEQMNQSLRRRGPDGHGICLGTRFGFAHNRLAILDPEGGDQPMSRTLNGKSGTIVYNGELYNMHPLRKELETAGIPFFTHSDTEVILTGLLVEGPSFVEKMDGIFAVAYWDAHSSRLFLFRDRLGVKPLFYMQYGKTLLFASQPRGILAYPGVEAVVDREGLCEIFALGPARTPGKAVFKDMKEVLPGHFLQCNESVIQDHSYWQLTSAPHKEDFDQTIDHTAHLLQQAVEKQMLSDIPICTFLSGGVDSSLVTAICAEKLRREGGTLTTFSFDFAGNRENFKANDFQPSQDRPWVDRMVDHVGTDHFYLECTSRDLADCLYPAVDAGDQPCMADVESSLLYFCSLVAPHAHVTLTGECADEIFGGYPWFHHPEALSAGIFPWSPDMAPRKALLSEELLQLLPLEEYARRAFADTVAETPLGDGEDPERRKMAYLNLRWFMATLLNRMDRTSMHSGLEARVPLADISLLEYVWNVPWEMKCKDGVTKGLLRHAGAKWLPDSVLWRRKSPYPKTYDPGYEALLGSRLREVLSDHSSPLLSLVDSEKVLAFINSKQDYGRPWYGQLMAGPQMLAYLLQIDYWLKTYRIRLTI